MIRVFAAFFSFGALMCALTIGLLLFPGSTLDALWRVNPEARSSFQSIGNAAFPLMGVVGIGCALAAVGLWRNARWGRQIAIVILSINIVGDLLNAVLRHDYRALIGLPIGGAMIVYLARYRESRS